MINSIIRQTYENKHKLHVLSISTAYAYVVIVEFKYTFTYLSQCVQNYKKNLIHIEAKTLAQT